GRSNASGGSFRLGVRWATWLGWNADECSANHPAQTSSVTSGYRPAISPYRIIKLGGYRDSESLFFNCRFPERPFDTPVKSKDQSCGLPALRRDINAFHSVRK